MSKYAYTSVGVLLVLLEALGRIMDLTKYRTKKASIVIFPNWSTVCLSVQRNKIWSFGVYLKLFSPWMWSVMWLLPCDYSHGHTIGKNLQYIKAFVSKYIYIYIFKCIFYWYDKKSISFIHSFSSVPQTRQVIIFPPATFNWAENCIINIAAKQIMWKLSTVCLLSAIWIRWSMHLQVAHWRSLCWLKFNFSLSNMSHVELFCTSSFQNRKRYRPLQTYLASEDGSHLLIFGGQWRSCWSCNLVDWQQFTMSFSTPNQKTFNKSHTIHVRGTHTAGEVREMHSATKR